MRHCINCGKSDSDTLLIRIPTYAMELGACPNCISRFGADRLAHEADLYLAVHFSDEARALSAELDGFLDAAGCFHCGGPVMTNPDGSRPLWCGSCHNELRRLRGA